MAKQTVTDELLDLEQRYWKAIQDKDIDTAAGLTDFPCIVAGARGVSKVDREMFVGMMKNRPYQLRRFSLGDEAHVRLLNDDVAVVAYKVHEELTVDGQPVTVDAADASTWVRRGGKWVCAMHTESIAGDSFGRDRGAAAQR